MHESNDFFEEQLSAIIDGEASELEIRRFLQQLDTLEASERDKFHVRWERYQRMAAGLRGQPAVPIADTGFANKVSQLLAEESMEQTVEGITPVSDSPRWFGARLAVAASAALAVIVGFQQYQISQQRDALRLAAAGQPSSASAVIESSVLVAPVNGSDLNYASLNSSESSAEPIDQAEAQRRLQEYLLEHANHASQQGARSIVPFARVANFETE